MNQTPARQAWRLAARLFTDPDYVRRQIGHRVVYKWMEPHAYLSDGRGYRRLTYVTFFLLWDCNLRCVMCNLWGEKGSCFEEALHDFDTLAVADWKKFVDDLVSFGPEIILTGGEPMMYRGWQEIAAYAASRGLPVSLITNGTFFTPKAIEAMLDAVERINVSLDGPPEIHDRIRKQPGSYDRIMEGLRRLQAAKLRRGQATPYVNIGYTIQPENQHALTAFGNLMAASGITINSLIYQHLEFLSEQSLAESRRIYQQLGSRLRIWEGFTRRPEGIQPALIARQAARLRSQPYDGFIVSFFPEFDAADLCRYYTEPDRFVADRPRRCIGPWVEALVTPHGDLWICPDYAVGNLRKQPFTTLWNNEKALTFRRRLQRDGPLAPVCRACHCFYTR